MLKSCLDYFCVIDGVCFGVKKLKILVWSTQPGLYVWCIFLTYAQNRLQTANASQTFLSALFLLLLSKILTPLRLFFFLFQYAKAKQIQSCSLFAIQGFSYVIVYGLNLKWWALTRDVYDFQHADSYWCQPIKNNPHPLPNKIVLHFLKLGCIIVGFRSCCPQHRLIDAAKCM